MTRSERRLFLACAALAAIVAFVGPWPIPEEAFSDAASIEAVAPVAAQRVGSPTEHLEAGFARREIVVPRGASLAGYGVRARSTPIEGTRDPCFARAIALRQGAEAGLVLGGDLLFVSALVRGRVLAALEKDPGIARDRVMFTATHTHSGPGNFAQGFAESIAVGRFREDVVAAIVEALVGAGREALWDLRPAQIDVARTQAPELVRNRYWNGERDVPIDADLTTFRFAQEERRGAIVVFSAHATVVGAEKPLVSADYPGGLARALEEEGYEVCLFAAGSVGSQAPNEELVRGTLGDAFDRAAAFGRLLAERVPNRFSVSRNPHEPAPAFSLRTIEVALPPPALRLAPDLMLSPVLAWTQLRVRAPVSMLRLGDDLLMGFPCEISGEVALAMKAAAAARGVRLTVLSFSGDYHGYVPRDEYWEEWRYENRLSLHGPRFAAYLERLAAAAVEAGR